MERREFEELRRQARDRDQPLKHPDHPRPVTRRQMLAQGFIAFHRESLRTLGCDCTEPGAEE